MRWMAALALLAGACDDGGGAGAPRITSVEPSAARVGEPVEVLGRGFCGEVGAEPDGRCSDAVGGFVTFGSAPELARAPVMAWTDTRIEVTVPAGVSGSTQVVVTVDDVASNAEGFEVLP